MNIGTWTKTTEQTPLENPVPQKTESPVTPVKETKKTERELVPAK